MVLWTISALRAYTVGVDTIVYVEMFENIPYGYVSRIEPGFLFFMKALSAITTNPGILIATSSFIALFGFFVFLKENSKAVFFSVFLMISFNYYFSTMNVMRQWIAMSIGFAALGFLRKGKKKTFIISVFAAALFHYSALVMLVYLLMYKKQLKKKNVCLLILLSAIGIISISWGLKIIFWIFPQYESMYANTDYMQGSGIGSVFEIAKLVVVILVLIIGKVNRNRKYDFEIFMLVIAIIVQLFSFEIAIISRLFRYFSVFELILIPNAFKEMVPSKQKNILLLLVVGMAIAYFFVVSFYRPEWTGAIPYSFR